MKKLILPILAFTFVFQSCQKEDAAVSKAGLKLDLQAGSPSGVKVLPTEEFYETLRGQTPIDIVESETVQYNSADPNFHYVKFDGSAISAKTHYSASDPGNESHTDFDEYNYKINVVGNSLGVSNPVIGNDNVYITIGGEKYYLIQYHFHYDSEHALNGKKSDMEVHLVHRAADGHVAVVGVFINKGDKNSKTLENVFSYLPEEETSTEAKEINGFNPSSLLPDNKEEYFTYSGSLTTPSIFAGSAPYLQGLRWFVFKNPITVSEESYEKYVEVFEHPNARPLQPVGLRTVLAHKAAK